MSAFERAMLRHLVRSLARSHVRSASVHTEALNLEILRDALICIICARAFKQDRVYKLDINRHAARGLSHLIKET